VAFALRGRVMRLPPGKTGPYYRGGGAGSESEPSWYCRAGAIRYAPAVGPV
jgi:hypothetical protein